MKFVFFVVLSTLFHTAAFTTATWLGGRGGNSVSVQRGLGSVEVEIVVIKKAEGGRLKVEVENKLEARSSKLEAKAISKEVFSSSLQPLASSLDRLDLLPSTSQSVSTHTQIFHPSQQVSKNKSSHIKEVKTNSLVILSPDEPGARGNNSKEGDIKNPSPQYPRQAILRGWQGETIVRIKVDEEGSVQDVVLIQSSGYSILDEAVLKVLKNWHFKSGKARQLEIPFKFLLETEI